MPSTGSVCVRYRYDEKRRKRLETMELVKLVVDEVDPEPREPKLRGETIVGLRVAWQEVGVRGRLKTAGGPWDSARRLWELRYDRVFALGLEDRIIRELNE